MKIPVQYREFNPGPLQSIGRHWSCEGGQRSCALRNVNVTVVARRPHSTARTLPVLKELRIRLPVLKVKCQKDAQKPTRQAAKKSQYFNTEQDADAILEMLLNGEVSDIDLSSDEESFPDVEAYCTSREKEVGVGADKMNRGETNDE
ncbi:uncharacterized protein LOC124719747 [Schistocerca piceifrons]|uniref:uncharacterized protein LOC124719747 n=1 Tax=Schistocerca piceifrons TaxID=274613 RepID=UPI001F5F567A|nr:uncharacterized protein LOC124719747 [Schistocerca piceifrons]